MPTTDRFPGCLAFSWRPENDGQPLHVDAHDPGGDTAWGVTAATWNAAVEHGYVNGALTDASKDDLAQVLRLMFWRVVQGDKLPPGVDLVVFDMSMVSGPGRAARILQKVVGAAIDGDIGPHTLAAVSTMWPMDVITEMTTADEAFFGTLHAFTYFGRGWIRRAEDAQTLALQMASDAAAAST